MNKDKEDKVIQEIIDRFRECVYYKVYKDLLLYGKCALGEDIEELIEIRKMLDSE